MMMGSVQQSPTQYISEKITFEEFLTRYNGVYAEWLRGEVVVYPFERTIQHQAVLLFLLQLVDYFVSAYKVGSSTIFGVVMRVNDEAPAREPDLMVLLNDHADQLKPTYLQAPADIVVEIVSPESSERDRGEKFVEYEAAKVPEYWLIDPLRKEASIYALNADGRYRRMELDSCGQLISTVLPGFNLDPSVLWQPTLPGGPDITPMIDAMQH